MHSCSVGSEERQQKKWRLGQEAVLMHQRVMELSWARSWENRWGEARIPQSHGEDTLSPFSTANLDKGVKYTLSSNKTEDKYVGVFNCSTTEL